MFVLILPRTPLLLDYHHRFDEKIYIDGFLTQMVVNWPNCIEERKQKNRRNKSCCIR